MLFRQIKYSAAITDIVIIILLSAILWAKAFFSLQPLHQNNFRLYSNEIYFFTNFSPFLSTLIAFLVIILQGFILNVILVRQNFFERKNFLPALFYIITMTISKDSLNFNSITILNVLLLIGLYKLLLIMDTPQQRTVYLDIGLIVSIATMLYAPAFVLSIFFFTASLFAIKANWKNLAAILVGILTPILFLFTYLFATDKLEILNHKILENFFINTSFIIINKDFYFVSIFMFTFLILSIIAFYGFNYNLLAKKRALFYLFSLYFLLIFISFVFNYKIFTANFLLLAIPSSIGLSSFFMSIKNKWLSEILFFAIYLSILFY